MGERLSMLDTMFLELEQVDESAHMHIGAALIFDPLPGGGTPEISEFRRAMRQASLPFMRDRIEEADRKFFDRVEKGFAALAAAEPQRVRVVEASTSIENVAAKIWELVRPVLPAVGRW